MKYKETGFRAFYHHFIAIPMKENLRTVLEGFPGAEGANCILTYGYIDQEAGLTLEILAAGRETEKGFSFADGNDSISSKIRIGSVADEEVAFFDDEDGRLSSRYAGKLEVLHKYDASEEIEKTRSMSFLDASRDEYCIDDVLVYLTKDGLEPEGCWVRIIGLGDHWFMGTLLNEPNQDFGYHNGEKISFFARETEDKKVVCISDMNPTRKLTAEDLEDGSLLEAAITAFNNERTEPHLIDILEILRDSYVWIPCNAVMSEEDQKYLDDLAQKLSGDSEADPTELIGKEFKMKGSTRMIPDILQNGDDCFFPVFSSVEAMGEYGEHFSRIQEHMLNVISLARNNDKKPIGIVINAFTEPFVLDAKIWDIVENMKSQITE